METRNETEEQRDQFVREVTAGMAAGSERSYALFYETYFDQIFRHMLVQTRGNEHLSKELTQAILLRVVRYIQAFKSERALWGWLRQIGRSCHVDWLRRSNKERAGFSIELYEEVLASESAPDSDDELLNALDRSIIELDAEERKFIKLAYFERLPQRAVAEQLHTTPKAVESKLSRIRHKLRRILLEQLKEYALL